MEYGRWPLLSDIRADHIYLDDYAELIRILASTSSNSTMNPKEIVFLEVDLWASQGDSTEFLDPWGSPYRLAVDADRDTRIALPSGTLKEVVVAWSLGPDQIDQFGLEDDIPSWD